MLLITFALVSVLSLSLVLGRERANRHFVHFVCGVVNLE
jgi:hypothetical protein